MVWNQKIAFRIFLAVLIVVFAFIAYIVLFDSSETPIAERLFDAIGFKSAEDADTEAVPLPSGSVSGSGGSGGAEGSGAVGGSSGSGSGNTALRFCTFNAYHVITAEVPCRCGFSAVCYSSESVCDATFNNGEGFCS